MEKQIINNCDKQQGQEEFGSKEYFLNELRNIAHECLKMDNDEARVVVNWHSNFVQETSSDGIGGFTIGIASLIEDVLQELRLYLGINTEQDILVKKLRIEGNSLLPEYYNSLSRLLNTIRQLLDSDIYSIADNILEAANYMKQFEKEMSDAPTCPIELAQVLAECAEYAYSDGSKPIPIRKDLRPLTIEELPDLLRTSPNDTEGILNIVNGLKLWVGKYKDDIVIAFSGTEIKHVGSVIADYQQLLASNSIYLYAAAVVSLFRKSYGKSRIYVVGHSLGGGLAQFAVTANQTKDSELLIGVGFNSAGLSMHSLNALGEEYIKSAIKRINHYTTLLDPVSIFGALIGKNIELPFVQGVYPGHSLDAIRKCIDFCLRQKDVLQEKAEENFKKADVDARGLPSPGYMGLQKANHIYIVNIENTRKCWPCFGRGYGENDGSESICKAKIYVEWAESFVSPNSKAQFLGGVVNTLNGTCHTLANRILALSDDDNACVVKSEDDAYSVVVWGKYGFGLSQYIHLISSSCNVNETTLKSVISKISNPYDDEFNAWCKVIGNITGLDINALIKNNSVIAEKAKSILKLYCHNREDVWVKHFGNELSKAPNKQCQLDFWKDYIVNIFECIAYILSNLVKTGFVTAEESNKISITLQNFIKEKSIELLGE